MIKIWEGLRSKADEDNDGQVCTNYIYRQKGVIFKVESKINEN